MSRITSLALTSAVSWAILAPAAFADLTAAQVWSDWRSYMESFGYGVSATENASGAQLAVSDIRITFDLPEDNGSVNMSVGNLTFVEAGDGTVDVVIPDSLPIAIETKLAEIDDLQSIKMSYTHSGQTLKVSGDPANMTYAYQADSMGMALDELTADGETLTSDQMRVNISANNVTSNTVVTVADTRNYVQDFNAEGLQYDVYVNELEEGEMVEFQGQLNRLSFTGNSTLPGQGIADFADIGAMLAAGFAFDGAFTSGAGSYKAKVEGPDGPFDLNSSSDGGNLSVKMGEAGLSYRGEQSNVKMNAQSAELPFAMELAMAQMGFHLAAPVQKTDTAQDFAFGVNLTDFTMSDDLWSLFDPTAQLPRDPATFLLDIDGKGKMLVDFFDPEALADMEAAARPMEVEALNLNALKLAVAGAELTGSGAVTLDNSTDIPVPAGSVDLALSGANALIDKLIAMGFLPEEQAMGARMMMGMFTVPGTEPDTLSSKIEMTEDGQILANGQRIK
ncbi:MAG: DUF2125 domain-containing protein [Sulfitobacter sp.]